MAPSARWTTMDSPVKPANDEGRGRHGGSRHAHHPTSPLSPSGLTGGSISPPARWTQMDSPVKPANDEEGGGVSWLAGYQSDIIDGPSDFLAARMRQTRRLPSFSMRDRCAHSSASRISAWISSDPSG